jgi:D-alanine-D-alanine ligase-like ATP-grasp enzyme
MNNIYFILTNSSKFTAFNLLKKSAEEREIDVHTINADDFDFTKEIALSKDDGLYRISSEKNARMVEKHLINNECQHLYKDFLVCMGRRDMGVGSSLIHQKYNLPIIPTVQGITSDRLLLDKYLETLGGFPIVIKALGGQHGVGVMKIDSLDSYYSIVDFLYKNRISFVIRRFLDYKEHARFIVLGDEVVSSIEYKRVNNDFRSNIGDDLSIVNKKFDPEIEQIAIDSVSTLGYEFGGVDILIDKDEKPYIAEVNFPCYFPRAQEFSKVDIAGMIIDHLISKSKK